MNWEKELLDLYDANQDIVGKVDAEGTVLLPLFHTTVKAQVEVKIDKDGNFIEANKVLKGDDVTIIPTTFESGSRTTNNMPHPLCDSLQYVSGDYSKYCVDEESDKFKPYFKAYIEKLEKWATSEYTNEMVNSIYKYLKKGMLIHDLINNNVIDTTKEGKIDYGKKINGIKQNKLFVRFIVEDDGILYRCWLDNDTHKSFIRYYRSTLTEQKLDYLTGSMEGITYSHPKKLRNEGDQAKLISSNDNTNYTYLGRFNNKEEAFSIGGETSYKIHNALNWIIRKQGKSFDSFTIVTWESSQQKMPNWDDDAEDIVSTWDEFYIDCSDGETEKEYDSNYMTAKRFNDALSGYGKSISNTSKMILISLDAATQGRVALTEYKSLESSKYLENIYKWHMEGGWRHKKYKNRRIIEYVGMPSVKDIAKILYGTEENGKMIIRKNSEKLYANVIKRLIPCIWDGRRVPYDMVQKSIIKASMPLSYDSHFNWEATVSLACSFVKKYRSERCKEEWNMSLDKECKDRSYLYGRLLSIADRIEYSTYDKEKDKKRVTNAKRYMNAFSQRPYTTWRVIEESIQPYLAKLNPGSRIYYSKLLDEVQNLFTLDTFKDNKKLDGLYLLGFHSQAFEMNNKESEK